MVISRIFLKMGQREVFHFFRNADVKTPLAVAALEGHADSVEALIEQGAKFNIKDKDDRSALFHAAANARSSVMKVSQIH